MSLFALNHNLNLQISKALLESQGQQLIHWRFKAKIKFFELIISENYRNVIHDTVRHQITNISRSQQMHML